MSDTALAALSFTDAVRLSQIPIAGAGDTRVDGIEPSVRVEPLSIDELQVCLQTASTTGARIVATGAGSRMQIGNAPAGVDALVSLRKLTKIIALEPADMTVTVEAGVGIEELQAALASHKQFLPLDPPGAAGTVGGLLASNVSGPLRHRYGTARDWLLGTRVVHADGSISKSGGRVVKNVSGYDMHKLYVGSLGTLGVLAEVTLKVAPLPKVDESIALAYRSAAAAASIVSACHERGLALVAAELLSPTAAQSILGQSNWCVLLRVGGGRAAVARTLLEVDDYLALADAEPLDAPKDVWTRWRATIGSTTLSLRISVLPSHVAETAEGLDRRFAGDAAAISCTVTAGLLRVNLKPSDDARAIVCIEHAREIAERRGGYVVVDAASMAVKQQIDVFGAERGDIEIMRRLKQELDPKRILAPGRFAGRI